MKKKKWACVNFTFLYNYWTTCLFLKVLKYEDVYAMNRSVNLHSNRKHKVCEYGQQKSYFDVTKHQILFWTGLGFKEPINMGARSKTWIKINVSWSFTSSYRAVLHDYNLYFTYHSLPLLIEKCLIHVHVRWNSA